MLLSALALLVPGTHASVTGARATVQSTNVLRYTVRVTTTEYARVAVQVWVAGSPSGSGWTTDYTTSNARNQTVNLWGMKPSTTYNYRIRVIPASGSSYTYANRLSFTTAALPATLPTLTATTYGGAPDFDYLLFDGRTTDTDQGVILIVDAEGVVRWYQTSPATTDTYAALYYAPEEEAIYAQLNQDRIVRYAMTGTTTAEWTLGAELPDYVHHEVLTLDGVLYTLTARSFTQGSQSYVEDGIQGFDSDGNLVYEWWSQADGGLDVTDNAPYAWTFPGVGYWSAEFPTSRDWLHANSLQVREEADGLKAYVSYRHTYQVAKVDMASGVVEWLLGANSTGSADSLGDFTLSSSGLSTTWWQFQHHAHYESDGLFYVYDNGDGRAMLTRALAMSIDESRGVATIEREVDYSDLVDDDFGGSCEAQSGAYRTENDHLVMSCGPAQFVADYDASDVLAWTLDIAGDYDFYRAAPLASIGN